MKCPNCGCKNMEDNRFCEQCGYAFIKPSENSENNETTNPQSRGYKNVQSANYNNGNNGQYGQVNNGYLNNYQYRQYSASPEISNSYFDGNMFQLLGWNILCVLITIITLGFGGPWANVLKIRWETKHTVINGKRLYFNGTAPQLFGKLILWRILEIGLLMILPIVAVATSARYAMMVNLITALVIDAVAAIFISPAFSIYIKRWETKHTTFLDDTGVVYNHMSNGQVFYPPTYHN